MGVLDFVISTEVAYHDVDVQIFGYKIGQIPEQEQFFIADKNMVQSALNVAESSSFAKEHKFVKGRIASGDQFIADKATKDKIIQNFEPMCVEMEGASVAQVCYLCNIPFLIIRSISDTPNNNNAVMFDEFLEKASKKVAEVMIKLIEKLDKENI